MNHSLVEQRNILFVEAFIVSKMMLTVVGARRSSKVGWIKYEAVPLWLDTALLVGLMERLAGSHSSAGD